MKKGIHPENYRPVVFKDMSNDEIFITRSTIAAKDTIEVDGETYPLVKLEITSSSHPFFTTFISKIHAEQTEISISSFIKKTGKTIGFARFLFVWPLYEELQYASRFAYAKLYGPVVIDECSCIDSHA